MKKILITGANSYIGTSFENYIKENFSDEYIVDTVDMIDGTWREKDFSGYDSVFHVAGIAHQKETRKNATLYYQVNCDLVIEVAVKAKAEGVKQFIFLSSMSVYGKDEGIIYRDTKPTPKSNYGKSKLLAEKGLSLLENSSFKIAILRPPMVYGKGCKGNFQTLIKIVEKFHVFPRINNQRSMIYVENLCGFVKLIIDNGNSGIFFPQNKKKVETKVIVQGIAKKKGIKLIFSYTLGIIVFIGKIFIPKLKKAFGSLIYKDTEEFDYLYCKADNMESILESI